MGNLSDVFHKRQLPPAGPIFPAAGDLLARRPDPLRARRFPSVPKPDLLRTGALRTKPIVRHDIVLCKTHAMR